MHNPMNPGLESYDEYSKYRTTIKKIKSLQSLDGLSLKDNTEFDAYNQKKSKAPNLFDFNNESKNELESVPEELDENELNNIIKMKKRQSTITYSQRMLKKADNLTKFNRKNHSEGNKHITNNDL